DHSVSTVVLIGSHPTFSVDGTPIICRVSSGLVPTVIISRGLMVGIPVDFVNINVNIPVSWPYHMSWSVIIVPMIGIINHRCISSIIYILIHDEYLWPKNSFHCIKPVVIPTVDRKSTRLNSSH